MKEEPHSERKLFGEKLAHNFEKKSNQKAQPYTPKTGMSAITDLVTPSPESKEECNDPPALSTLEIKFPSTSHSF